MLVMLTDDAFEDAFNETGVMPVNQGFDRDTDLESVLILAEGMHKEGLNCAETVVWGLARHWGGNPGISAATGFGGGIARSRATCGALTGAILALGELVGRTEPGDREAIGRCYRLGKETMRLFGEHMGTTVCREILESEAALALPRGSRCKEAIATAIRAAARAVTEEATP